MSLIEHLDNYLELITYGFTNPMPDSNEGPWKITAKDVINGKINYDTARKTTIDSFENDLTPKSKPKINDILLTKDGTLGRLAIVDQENICVNQSVAVLRPNKKIIPQFLYYLLSSPYYQKTMLNDSDGSVLKHIYITRVKKMDVQIPDLTHQKKIIQILEFIDNKIDVLIKLNKNLEQLMKCIFDDWFVNFNYSENIIFKPSELGEIPSNWNIKKLNDVLITLESGKRPKGGISEINEGIPSIGAENIIGLGKFNYSKNKLVPYDFFDQMKKGIIQDQDVLLYKDGAQLGRKSLFMNGFPFDICCINEHVFRLQSNDEISQFYLYLWLDQEMMTNEIINLNSNSAQPGINQNDVKSLPILVPDSETMDKFNNIISPMINQIFDNALEINKLSKLRDTLLPKLMSGEIDVSKINCDLIIVTFYFYFEILFN